jgi:hypothetical protein
VCAYVGMEYVGMEYVGMYILIGVYTWNSRV